MSVLKEEYSLPNSNWLQKLLKDEAEIMKEVIEDYLDDEDKTDYDIEDIQQSILDLEILTTVAKLAAMSGKYVILTKKQWDGLHNIIKKILVGQIETEEIFISERELYKSLWRLRIHLSKKLR
jgi:hypothetical protein